MPAKAQLRVRNRGRHSTNARSGRITSSGLGTVILGAAASRARGRGASEGARNKTEGSYGPAPLRLNIRRPDDGA